MQFQQVDGLRLPVFRIFGLQFGFAASAFMTYVATRT